MRKVKKILALLLICLMIVSLAACGSKDEGGNTTDNGGTSSTGTDNSSNTNSGSDTTTGSDSSSTGGGDTTGSGTTRDTLTVAVDVDGGSLNPTQLNGGTYVVTQMLYESLWEYTESGKMIPILMESYEEVDVDHWVVHLRQGITFSNGNPLTASDVVFSLNYWKTVGVNAVRVQSLDETRTKVIDDYTLDLYLPSFYVAHKTAASMFMIFDEESFDVDSLTLNPVGTGPYVLKEYVNNSHVYVERREDYWGEKPAIKNLQFKVVSEPSQIVNGLVTGTIDVAQIALADYDYVNDMPNYVLNERYTGGGIQIGFNAGQKGYFNRFGDPDKSLEARYAVIHAIDPQVIIDIVYEGHGMIMEGYNPSFCLDWEPAFDNNHPTYSEGYNLDLAKQYADSSGLTGQTITLMITTLPANVMIAEIVQDMLSKIDVTVEIISYDAATVNTMQYDPEADFDMRIGFGIAPNWRIADGLVNGVRYSPQLTAPGAFPNNDYYLELAPLTYYTADDDLRREYLTELLYLFVDNALQYSLCMYSTVTAINKDIDLSSIERTITTGWIRYDWVKWA